MNDIKQQIMNEIEKNSEVFKQVSPIRYRIRCPICGDSQKDPKDAHCYLKCDYNNPNEPILYNCFLANCNAKGKVDKKFLRKLGIKSNIVDQLNDQRYNRINIIKENNVEILCGNVDMNSKMVDYVEWRLGPGFTKEDFDKFKIVWDMNYIYQYISDVRIKNTLPSNLFNISFISDDKSSLLTRSYSDDGSRWRKIKLFQSDNKSFYVIKCTLDLFTPDLIYINIAEGIFDVLSAYKNFNDGPNSVFVALLGSDYESGIEYIIQKGLLGYNVVLKIYLDSEINEESLKFRLKKYKFIFDKIILYKNIKYKDIGTKIDKIKLMEYHV